MPIADLTEAELAAIVGEAINRDLLLSLVAEVRRRRINDQRANGWPDVHPETYCHRCGGVNVPSWSIDSDRFNQAMGRPAEHRWEGIVCPGCFVVLHEQATGLTTSWKLVPDPLTPFRWRP